ncbi:MAG: hypothetical protein MH219_20525 [Marinobacter sp.]|nr:hypothetical protein [Marinobacter sp.]MCL1481482.1 hypothetical protein [Marinobacter sp.]
MGALEYKPDGRNTQTQVSGDIKVDTLVELAQSVLDQRAGLDVAISEGDENNDAMSAIFQVGTSAGGARPKAVIAVNRDRSRVVSGQTPYTQRIHSLPHQIRWGQRAIIHQRGLW